MKALVINLDSAKERMTFQKQQLDNLGIKFERISATVVPDKNNPIYQKYYKTWQRPLRLSEVGCFMSHKKAWNYVLEQNEPILILEDDAFFSHDITNIIEELQGLEGIDYINLEVTGSNKEKVVAQQVFKRIGETNLFRLYQGRSGAGGYILWPSGAKKLLSKTYEKETIGLVDAFINSCYSLKSYQLEPAIIIQLDQCKFHKIKPPIEVVSSISSIPKPSSKQHACWVCKWRRFKAQITIGLNQLYHLPHSIKRRIALSDKFPRAF